MNKFDSKQNKFKEEQNSHTKVDFKWGQKEDVGRAVRSVAIVEPCQLSRLPARSVFVRVCVCVLCDRLVLEA